MTIPKVTNEHILVMSNLANKAFNLSRSDRLTPEVRQQCRKEHELFTEITQILEANKT